MEMEDQRNDHPIIKLFFKVTNDIFDEIPPDIFDDNENNIEPLI